ncbi:MAG: AsmA family protein, partial [Chitinivibrionales bacterium]|nr:AsmA family protein [Chitinivibrionales bacterium]
MKKVLIIAGIAAGAVVTLFVAAYIVLSVMFPPERIKALVVPPVEKALGRPVALEGTGVTVFPGLGVKLEGVTIGNTARKGFAERPFVKLGQFVVRVKLLPLLGGK